MNMQYIVTSPLKIYNDCSFASKVIYSLKPNDLINREFDIGPWSKISYKNIEGFIYPFSSTGELLLTNNSIYKNLKNNDLVVFKTKNKKIKDEYGKEIINIDENNSKQFFIIKELLENPRLIKINDINGESYWVKPSLIEKVKKENIDKDKNPEVYENYIYDTLTGAIEYLGNRLGLVVDTSVPFTTIRTGGVAEANSNLASLVQQWAKVLYNEQYKKEIEESKNNILGSLTSSTSSAFSKIRGLEIGNLRSIFGIPYQYLPIADMRMGKRSVNGNIIGTPDVSTVDSLGIKYAEKIIARMPLFIMVPGVTDFMQGFSKDERSSMIQELYNGISGDYKVENTLNKWLAKDNRQSFYSLYPAWSQYYNFVNPMCHVAAKMMGLDKVKVSFGNDTKNATFGDFNWRTSLPDVFNKKANLNGGCAFYINSETQMSESLSNSTTMSQIANKVNALSDTGRELLFLSGTASGMIQTVGETAHNIIQPIINGVQSAGVNTNNPTTGNEILRAYENSSGAVNALLNGVHNTLAGSKMLFPELWQDSSFSRDYNVTIKLDSPDNDRLSLYLNIIVPLIHLIAFAAPRFMGPTTYASPFLVRAYYQGFFNINMGIITSLNINRGAEGAWTLDNIPTVVEVQFTIHDLFATNITITPETAGSGADSSILGSMANTKIIQNTPMLDYIGNLCGVNVNEPDLAKIISYYELLIRNIPKRIGDNAFMRLTEWVAAGKTQFYQQFLSWNSMRRWF